MYISDVWPQTRLKLLRRAKRPGRLGALLAGAALKLIPSSPGDLQVELWGRPLLFPAAHHVPFIVGNNPFWSMPLVHCLAALPGERLTVVDVGANIGDSVAILESHHPGRLDFICVEANPEWVPYLKVNTAGLPVEIIQSFVGEGQSLVVKPTAPGSAGSQINQSGEPSRTLDEICNGRHVDLIKIDTDGFDFPVLRSAARILSSQRPALFFEWDPSSWREQGESLQCVFTWLSQFGYDDFCFFSDGGYFYCRTNQPNTIESLIQVAECRRSIDALHWDVFAAPSAVCDHAIRNNVNAAYALAEKVKFWNRLQPTYWQ